MVTIRRISALFLACMVIILSCKKAPEKPETAAEEFSPALTDGAVYTELDPSLEYGVILTEASLMEQLPNGNMKWKSYLNAGDTVIWKNEMIEAVRDYDKIKRNFYRVDQDGDYWVQEYAIAGPAVPGVITAEETVLYSKPDLTGIARGANVVVPRYALIAVLSEGQTDDFVKIRAWLRDAPVNNYVKRQNVSTSPDDISCIKLVSVAQLAKNAVAKKELLKNAIDFARKSTWLDRIIMECDGDPALFELTLTNNLELLSGDQYTVTGDTINVRDMPSLVSNVTGSLSRGTHIRVNAKTKTQTTITVDEEPVPAEQPKAAEETQDTEQPKEAAQKKTELKGAWYRTDSGGWDFGAYIEKVSR